MGFATLRVEHNGNKHELNFVIVGQKVTPLLGLKSYQIRGLRKIMISGVDIVCYTAVFSVVTQEGALRDDAKNGCVAD